MGERQGLSFKGIKVKSIDDKSPYLYPNRSIEIRTSEGVVNTPTRAATLYEYNQKGRVPTETTIENGISLSIRKLNSDKVKEFLLSNGTYRNMSSSIEEAEDMMKYSPFRAHIIQPTTTQPIEIQPDKTKKKLDSAVQYLAKNTKEREKFLRLIIKMQSDLGLSIITVPYLGLPLSDYKQLVTETAKIIRNQGREPLYIFDLDYQKRGDKFAEAVSFLIKEAEIKLIAFPYRSFVRNAISYDTLSQYITKDVAFLSINTEREDELNSQISTMHYLPFMGNDIYAIKSPRYVPPPEQAETSAAGTSGKKQELTTDSIKFFNPRNLLIESSAQRVRQPPLVLEEMNEKNNSKLLEVLDDYGNIGTDSDKMNVFRALSKIHELKSSTKEFAKLQKLVDSQESKVYVEEKTYLKSSLSKFKSSRKKD